MYFITKWDDCEDGLYQAVDYKECYIEVYGDDYDEFEDEDNKENDF